VNVVGEKWRLSLYVAGRARRLSCTAENNLRALCETYLTGRYEIRVVDLLEEPHLARMHEIVAVPTVVREHPVPLRKVIGDLTRNERTLLGLDDPFAPAFR
jgi:circadian clock protein KaiB